MSLLDQWPEVMHATPETVEVAAPGSFLTYNARTGVPLVDLRPYRGANWRLRDEAHIEAVLTTTEGSPATLRHRFSWRDQHVDDVRSAAFVDGTWWVANAEGVVNVTTGSRLKLSNVRLLAAGGTDLVVLRKGELSRWVGGTQHCSSDVDARLVGSIVANDKTSVIVTRAGALAFDRDCRPVGAVATLGAAWGFDGERLWAWVGSGVHRLSLPSFELLDETEPRAWTVGKRLITQAASHLDLTSTLGAVEARIAAPGLESLTSVSTSGDTVAVSDGRVVAIVGGPRWTVPGVVTAIRSVGPAGVTVEARLATNLGVVRTLTLGEAPGPEPTAEGVPGAWLRAPRDWTIPTAEPVTPHRWALSWPVASMVCEPLQAEVDGVTRPWGFARPTLVTETLPDFLPYGIDALSPDTSPSDDRRTLGRADVASLHDACGRWIYGEAWTVRGRVASAWSSVRDARLALEAEVEGWRLAPGEVARESWRVPAGGELQAVRSGVIVASPQGSVLFAADGSQRSYPGWLSEIDGTLVSHVAPWSLILDRAGAVRDVVVGRVVALDGIAAVRRDTSGLARVERDGDRSAVTWGPVLGVDAAVAGWSCERHPDTGEFDRCSRDKQAASPAQTVGRSTWTLEDGTLTLRRGAFVVWSREGVDEAVAIGDSLLVRSYASDRPWVRYDQDGRVLSVLGPGDLAVKGGSVWLYDENSVNRFDG